MSPAEIEDLAVSLGLLRSKATIKPKLLDIKSWGITHFVSAAVLCLVMMVGAWYWFDQHAHPVASAGEQQVTVATINRVVGTDLADHFELRPNGRLESGDILGFGAGFVEVVFNDGAIVIVTGPAKLRIDAADHATLFSGKLSAKVNEQARGFTVDTPDAEVVDLGTEFSLSVPSEGATQIKVTSGLVDVIPEKNRNVKTSITSGQAREVSEDGSLKVLTGDELELSGIIEAIDIPDYSIASNKDVFVKVDAETEPVEFENDLLLKYDIISKTFNRVVLIGFDLSGIPREKITASRLILTVAPNNIAGTKPSSRGTHLLDQGRRWKFLVSGVWGDGLSAWTEESVNWNNAPGIDPNKFSGNLVGFGAPMALGQFEILEQGQAGDQIVIDGHHLVDSYRQIMAIK